MLVFREGEESSRRHRGRERHRGRRCVEVSRGWSPDGLLRLVTARNRPFYRPRRRNIRLSVKLRAVSGWQYEKYRLYLDANAMKNTATRRDDGDVFVILFRYKNTLQCTMLFCRGAINCYVARFYWRFKCWCEGLQEKGVRIVFEFLIKYVWGCRGLWWFFALTS